MAPTIVIAAGGTAGHVVPALAVADALRAEGGHVGFVGGERAERTMVPVAGPVGLAAVTGRVPIVLAEADSHLGLTNRLLARWARRVCLAFPIAGRDGDGCFG